MKNDLGIAIDITIQTWFADTVLHRENGPAIEWSNGAEMWYRHGKIHRADGPAVIRENGDKEWWLNGVEYDSLVWLIKVHDLEEHSE